MVKNFLAILFKQISHGSVKVKDKKGINVKAIPNPDFIFSEDDTMVVAGEIKSINLIKNLL